MSKQIIAVPRQADKIVFGAFEEISTAYSRYVTHSSVQILGGVNVANPFSGSEVVSGILKRNAVLINSLNVSFLNVTFSFQRGGTGQEKSPFVDEITITQNHNATSRQDQPSPLSDSDKIEAAAILVKKLKVFEKGRVPKSPISKEQQELLAIHEATLSRLEHLNEDLLVEGQKFRQQLESEYAARKTQLDEANSEDLKERREELADLESGLKEKERKLQERVAAVDDRENTHARRDLREAILEELQKRSAEFQLTSSTNKLRMPIHLACIVAVLMFGGGAFWYSKILLGYITAEDLGSATALLVALKQFGLAFAAIGTMTFYIRWLNKWFELHAEAEFRLKQFQLDIERASWAVETSLEWQAQVAAEFPDKLLNAITKNLFSEGKGQGNEVLHPTDQLASALLGTASKVRVQAGDAQIDFSGKDLKKAKAKEKSGE